LRAAHFKWKSVCFAGRPVLTGKSLSALLSESEYLIAGEKAGWEKGAEPDRFSPGQNAGIKKQVSL
jgi:hypothetical protein